MRDISSFNVFASTIVSGSPVHNDVASPLARYCSQLNKGGAVRLLVAETRGRSVWSSLDCQFSFSP